MENASKALLIAGEVLVGIIILSIFAYVFSKNHAFSDSYKDNIELREIVEFNNEYTKYATRSGSDPTYIYSEDVVTLTEKVINWNNTTIDDYKIELEIYKEGSIIYKITKISIPEFHRKTFLIDNKLIGDIDEDNKEYRFSCRVNLSNTSGRVNEIIIETQGVKDD